MTTATMPALRQPEQSTGRRAWLAAEFLILFFGLVAGYWLVGSPGSPVPVLIVLGLAAWIYLRRQPAFDRARLLGVGALRAALPSILRLWVGAAVALVAVLAVVAPDRLFDLPRERPLIWLLVVVFYPLLSVYPQELIFRGFLTHRYAPVFGAGVGMVAGSATAFGFAHIIYGTVASVLLTFAGGALFSWRYLRTGSLLTASVEHALYGVLAFTAGLGDLFYSGAGAA